MKKLFIIVLALVTATTTFALPPLNVKAPRRSSGPRIVFRKDAFAPETEGVSKSPNRAMATTVAISGFGAMGVRFLEELAKSSQDMIIVVPEGTTTPIVIKEMDPVVTHQVPISPLPIEIIRSH